MEQKLSFPIICLTLLLCSLPTESQIQMSINPQEIVLGSSSPVSTTFTCTISGDANIADILTMLILRKRKTDMDFVVVGQVKVQDPANAAFVPTAPQDIVSRGSMSGGIDVNTPTSSTLTLTLSTQDLVCADKGEYQCKIVYIDAYSSVISVQNNGTLSIYESEIQMSINPPQVVLGSSSPVSTTFTCTISGSANIREIFVMQLLRKRESDMDFVMVGEVTVTDPNPAFVPTAPQDIVSRGSMSGGIDVNTPTSSTLTLTLSTQDLVCADKGEYQCMMVYLDAYSDLLISVQNNGTLSIYESEIQMSINPQEIVLGSSSPVSTTFTCTIPGSANIPEILAMQLLRKRQTDMDFVVVGRVNVQDPANPAFVPTAPQDIVSRGSMSGGIDVNTPTSSTLTLTLSTQDLVCADKGEYQCMMVYLDAANKVINVQNNGTLSIYDQEPTTTERAQTLTNVTNKGEESGVDVVIG